MALNFPELSVTEAAESCRELFGASSISEEDIKNPKSQKLQVFYARVVQDVNNLTQDQVTQAPFQAMQEMFNPENLHEESIPLLVFSLVLQRFMITCGVNNFTIKDILQPKPKRTLRIISAILNFAKFKESRLEVFDNAMAEVDAIQQQKNHLILRNQELTNAVENLKAARAQEDEQIQQMMPVIEALQNEVNVLNKHQAEEVAVIKDIQASTEENVSKMAELRVNIASVKEECEKAKCQIVSSPERLKGDIGRVNNMVQVCKEGSEQKAKRIVELISQKDNREKFLEKILNCLQIIKCISADMDKHKEILTLLETKTDGVSNKNHLLVDLIAKLQNVKHALQSKHEKHSRQARQQEKRVSSIKDDITNLQREEQILEAGLTNISQSSREIMEKKNHFIAMLQDKENNHNLEITFLQNIYTQLLEQLDEYHKSLTIGYEDLCNTTTGL